MMNPQELDKPMLLDLFNKCCKDVLKIRLCVNPIMYDADCEYILSTASNLQSEIDRRIKESAW